MGTEVHEGSSPPQPPEGGRNSGQLMPTTALPSAQTIAIFGSSADTLVIHQGRSQAVHSGDTNLIAAALVTNNDVASLLVQTGVFATVEEAQRAIRVVGLGAGIADQKVEAASQLVSAFSILYSSIRDPQQRLSVNEFGFDLAVLIQSAAHHESTTPDIQTRLLADLRRILSVFDPRIGATLKTLHTHKDDSQIGAARTISRGIMDAAAGLPPAEELNFLPPEVRVSAVMFAELSHTLLAGGAGGNDGPVARELSHVICEELQQEMRGPLTNFLFLTKGSTEKFIFDVVSRSPGEDCARLDQLTEVFMAAGCHLFPKSVPDQIIALSPSGEAKPAEAILVSAYVRAVLFALDRRPDLMPWMLHALCVCQDGQAGSQVYISAREFVDFAAGPGRGFYSDLTDSRRGFLMRNWSDALARSDAPPDVDSLAQLVRYELAVRNYRALSNVPWGKLADEGAFESGEDQTIIDEFIATEVRRVLEEGNVDADEMPSALPYFGFDTVRIMLREIDQTPPDQALRRSRLIRFGLAAAGRGAIRDENDHRRLRDLVVRKLLPLIQGENMSAHKRVDLDRRITELKAEKERLDPILEKVEKAKLVHALIGEQMNLSKDSDRYKEISAALKALKGAGIEREMYDPAQHEPMIARRNFIARELPDLEQDLRERNRSRVQESLPGQQSEKVRRGARVAMLTLAESGVLQGPLAQEVINKMTYAGPICAVAKLRLVLDIDPSDKTEIVSTQRSIETDLAKLRGSLEESAHDEFVTVNQAIAELCAEGLLRPRTWDEAPLLKTVGLSLEKIVSAGAVVRNLRQQSAYGAELGIIEALFVPFAFGPSDRPVDQSIRTLLEDFTVRFINNWSAEFPAPPAVAAPAVERVLALFETYLNFAAIQTPNSDRADKILLLSYRLATAVGAKVQEPNTIKRVIPMLETIRGLVPNKLIRPKRDGEPIPLHEVFESSLAMMRDRAGISTERPERPNKFPGRAYLGLVKPGSAQLGLRAPDFSSVPITARLAAPAPPAPPAQPAIQDQRTSQ